MPPSNVRKTRKQRARRGRAYLLGTLVLVLVIAVGWYVYASTQSANLTVATVYATLNTSQGSMTVELYGNAAPKTVTNFVNLAQSGFYDNLVWHRIVKDCVIQTGDPNTRNLADRSSWGQRGSLQTVPLEAVGSLHNNVGYLAMARFGDDLNSATSQFYINLANNGHLDGKYAVFGKVIRGMDVAFAIANVPVNSQSQPIDPVFLTSATVSNTLPA